MTQRNPSGRTDGPSTTLRGGCIERGLHDIGRVRLGALALGLTCAGLGCFGAWEFALKLEGAVTYLVVAAPVIAACAALIPVIAEATWRDGNYLKALLWWVALVPAGAVVFFSAAERVFVAKAGAQAERVALRSAASRAQAALTGPKQS